TPLGKALNDVGSELAAVGFEEHSHVDASQSPPALREWGHENSADSASLAYAAKTLAALPAPLSESLRQPQQAQAVMYALLLSSAPDIHQQQLATLTQAHDPETAQAAQSHEEWLLAHGSRHRLTLLDLALPALRELPPEAILAFLSSIDMLVKADGRLSASEFALRHILKRALKPYQSRWPSLRLERLNHDIALLLALLARAGNSDKTARIKAFQHAAAQSPASSFLPFPDKKDLTPEAIETALDHLAQAAPRFREKILAACRAAVEHDGKITVEEAELLRAVAQSLDCPAPPVFADAA
ncbi:MAG: hypothetical protein LBS89_02510, partial [Zoogloeaceae bacterium]|nr:hypothetical protein [Zoogloeaceae bacterium]